VVAEQEQEAAELVLGPVEVLEPEVLAEQSHQA
jgi:hypothetical protein